MAMTADMGPTSRRSITIDRNVARGRASQSGSLPIALPVIRPAPRTTARECGSTVPAPDEGTFFPPGPPPTRAH